MSITVVAEKPSVARDIARVLGATKKRQGYLEGGGYRVTWAIGHLVTLAEPHEIDAGWKKWRRESLPMLPGRWPLVVIEKTREQFDVVKHLLTAPDVEQVVCATDAGREGELIFRYIHEAAGCDKPVKRLWISSLTDGAIRKGFETLEDAARYDGLGDAARGRSCADWLVGMNLSRAYGLSLDQALSVGRVQTPTLAMLVDRELAIRDFVPEAYWEVVGTFSPRPSERYDGTWLRPEEKGEKASLVVRKRLATADEARAIVERCGTGQARVKSVTSETKRMPPPRLYDLTELQRHANRLYGFTAQHTLEIAQRLYETHKVLSYPRTDSRHLSQPAAATLGNVVDAIRPSYEPLVAEGSGVRPLGKRHVDDRQVTDHHALIPTEKRPGNLDADERKVYDLVCRRLLQAWHGDFVWAATTVLTEVRSEQAVDLFHSIGTAVEEQGWKVLDLGAEKKTPKKKTGDDATDQSLPAGLAEGQQPEVVGVKSQEKKTRPPPRFDDASLLTAMETAGRTLDEKELSRAMKDSGLGTPATRAQIIETLLQREYVVRSGKALEATDKGIGLIEVVDDTVKSPVMTGQWEARLQAIERGRGKLATFVEGIERYVSDVVGRVPAVHPKRLSVGVDNGSAPADSSPPASTEKRPRPGETLGALLERVFGFASFRPHQEAVCRAASEGHDVLLVMPTGAGKSLCYQLPGLARGGTTLVVSPLIALIEDQVAKLRALGLNAARIHSGLSREASRQVCRDYLNGALDYLFIAPERLGVPGFPEMLAKRTPSLVAIDEAHCISQWGHDFRPDYRLLGQRLPLLRPAPIVAVTATATPLVQQDIAQQLGLRGSRAFIHGFRRTNLAIEVREAQPSDRLPIALRLLKGKDRLPAILYAPTRKRAQEVADTLSGHFKCSAYHAGMTPEARDRVQAAFLSGRLEVVVATVAFGMGVDKADVRTVVHLALPASVEGYYQEIGRAGRDGAQSKAVLLHSYVDRHTHRFFHERDYPEPEVLQKVFDAVSQRPIAKETIRRKTGERSEVLDKALEKLWMAGAVEITPEEDVRRGRDGWRAEYVAQRNARAHQSVLMGRYTESHGCRMLHLVAHFGDREDTGRVCGICDVCAPEQALTVTSREPNEEELRLLKALLDALRAQDNQATGRLAKQLLGDTAEQRRACDRLLGGLVRAGLVALADDAFEKDGRRIEFQRARLTRQGKAAAANDVLSLVLLPEEIASKPAPRKRAAAKMPTKAGRPRAKPVEIEASPLAVALKAWRLAEARRRRVPAFRIFTDRVLAAICTERPMDGAGLLAVPGVGPKLVEASGVEILALCREHDRGNDRWAAR